MLIRERLPIAQDHVFTFHNMSGKMLKTATIAHQSHFELAITDLAKGMYIYQFVNEKGLATYGKLLVQ